MPNNLPEPETRKEMFLASAAGAPVEVLTPITREEVFLDAIAKGGGVSPDDAYTKSQTDALLASKVDKEIGKDLSTNDFTDTDKANLTTALTKANAAAPQATTYTKPEVDAALDSKADATDIPAVPITTIQKNGTDITPVSGTVNITVPTTAADISALPDTIKYAVAISLTINSSTFVVTCQLKDQNGDNLGTSQTIDLPLESVVVGGSYNSQTKKVVLTLQNGNTIEFSVADLVSGLQTELSASNKLNPSYINYDSTHRAVSDTEKSTWNGKQSALTTAQLAAVNSGITSEKLETIDTALSDKVDKETGKGLSTNDFTNSDKANLGTALTKANAAAPQATTYTKSEVDTALAAKLNTADVDADLSSTSTNPVQNKAVQAQVARLVDAGAKNIAFVSAAPSRSDLNIQVVDEHVSISGTVNGSFTWQAVVFDNFVCEKDMVVIGAKNRSGVGYQCRYTDSGGGVHYDQIPDGGILTIPAGSTIQYLYFQQNTGGVYISIEVDVMICTAEDYAISQEVVPYTPTMRELYEMILALQNGG